ncbi:hypothetical protein Tco_0204113 [Tanacetum coccineum]
MQDDLLQLKLQKVCTLVDLPNGDILLVQVTACKAEGRWDFYQQDKYVTEILKEFGFTNVKTASTPMETQKALLKDKDGEEVDVHLYRSMIGSLMYLTSSRLDIMLKCVPYPKDSPFDLVAYTDSDYARASLDRKSTTGGCQFLGCRLISWQCKKQTMVVNSTTEAEYVAASNEVVHKELGDSLERAGTTTSSLEAEQDRMFESVSKHSNDSPLVRGQTLRSDKDRLILNDWIDNYGGINAIDADEEITLVNVHDVNVSANEEVFATTIDGITLVSIDAIDANEEITLVSVHDMNISAGEEVFATTVDDITLAQVLEEMKSTKPKKKGVVIQELGESTTTISSQLSSQQSQDKGKRILIEHVKPMHKKDLIRLDEETALNLQAEFDEEERLAREKAEKEEEANIALIETWDDIQAKIDVDHQLAKRMQAQEQEELSIEEKATLFQQLLEKRRKHFATKRAEDKRNKPPTKAQERKIMCTYLKNMEGYKLKDLKLKEFDSI